MSRFTIIAIGSVIVTTFTATKALAAIDVSMWDLRTSVSGDQSQAFEIISQISNPLHITSLSSLNNGIDYSRVEYDCSWLMDEALAHFNMSITHAIRSPKVRSVSRSQIFILANEDIRVSIEGSMTYSHTPGDEDSINFSASARDVATGDYAFLQLRQGGNLYLEPASGTLSFGGEAILTAGIVYRLQYVLDCSNTGDLLPTGTLDANGYVHFAINPVPEAATLSMLLPCAVFLTRRRKRANVI